MDVAVVAVCDAVPEIAGLVAHYLSIALDVLHREGHRGMRVGVVGPYSLGDSMHAVAVGEPHGVWGGMNENERRELAELFLPAS